MNNHAVVLHRDVGRRYALAILEAGGGEIDVVGLPSQGRQAHINERIGLLIKPAAFVVEPLQAEAVENLQLIAVLQIDATISTALSGGVGHEGKSKFQMQDKVLELDLA